MKKLICILSILFVSQHIWANEINDLYLSTSVKRMCSLNIPETIEFKDISSSQLIGNEAGLAIGKPEYFEVMVDCGLDPSNLLSLELEPGIVDEGCLGINENPKIIRLCVQYKDEQIDLGEDGRDIPLNTISEPKEGSQIVMKFTVIPQTGKDGLQERIEGEYTAFLNIRLNFE